LGQAAGLSVGFLSGKITLPDGTEVFGLGALARALETKGDVNILSTPNLLMLDNVEAKIVIGQNVPFLTGSFTSTAATGTVNPFQTIERKDVGLVLKIKPQISEGGGVKMQISQEVSSVASAQTAGAQGLVTNKRTIDTTVIADDGHIIVLGGLIEERVSEDVQGIPILSKLPLLGELFTFRNRTKKKTNLMVFLRPVIVRSAEDIAGFTQERYEQMRFHELKSQMDRHLILPRFAPPTLPEFRQPPPKPVPEPKDDSIVIKPPTDAPALDAAPQPVETVVPTPPPATPEPKPTEPAMPPAVAPPPPPTAPGREGDERLGPPSDTVMPPETPGTAPPAPP